MPTYLYEVVKEYVLIVEGLDHSVKGRIERVVKDSGTEEYYWAISHYYRGSESAGTPYSPSRRTTNSFDESRALLLMYMRGFTTIGVTPNERF